MNIKHFLNNFLTPSEIETLFKDSQQRWFYTVVLQLFNIYY